MDHQHPNNQHPNINQTQNQQQLYGNPIANLSNNNINNVDGTHLPNGGYQPNFYNEQYPIPHPPNSFNLNNTPHQYQQYQQYQQFLQFQQFEQYRNHPYYQSPHQTPFTQPQFRPFQPVPQQFAQLFQQQQQQPPQSAVNNSRVGSINNSGNGNKNNINDKNNNNNNNSTTTNSNNSTTTTNNNTTNTSNTDSNSSSDSKSCCVWTGIFDHCSNIPDDINIWNVKNGKKIDRKLNKMMKKAKEEVYKRNRDKQAQLCIFNIINIKMMKPTSILQEWTTDAMLVLFCKGAAQCLDIKRLSYKHVVNCVKYNWYKYLMDLAIKYNKDEQFKQSLIPTYYENYKNIIPMLKAFISYTNVKVEKGCLKRSNLNLNNKLNNINNINTDNNMNATNPKPNETNNSTTSIRYGPVRGTSNNVLLETANERMSTLRSSALGCIDNDNDADDENDDDEDDKDDEDQLIQDVMNTIDFKKICGWQEDGFDN